MRERVRLIAALRILVLVRAARVLLFIGRMCDRKAFELARKIDARVDAGEAAEKLAGRGGENPAGASPQR
jgi:hypothetical protein